MSPLITTNDKGQTIINVPGQLSNFNVDAELHASNIYDDYSCEYFRNIIPQLIEVGMSARGIHKVVTGQLDNPKRIKAYCQEAMISFRDVNKILNPYDYKA